MPVANFPTEPGIYWAKYVDNSGPPEWLPLRVYKVRGEYFDAEGFGTQGDWGEDGYSTTVYEVLEWGEKIERHG